MKKFEKPALAGFFYCSRLRWRSVSPEVGSDKKKSGNRNGWFVEVLVRGYLAIAR